MSLIENVPQAITPELLENQSTAYKSKGKQ